MDADRDPAQNRLFYSTIEEDAYVSYFEAFRKGQYRQVLRLLRLPHRATLLDVGASYGWMVEAALETGLDAYGLEPGSAEWNSEIAPRMFRSSLEDFLTTSDRQFDVVTIWHVLEHLPDPVTAVDVLRRIVKRGGALVVAVPTRDGWMFRLALLVEKLTGNKRLLNELFYFHNPNMHFFYYGVKGIRRLLERAGLRIVNDFTLEAFDWMTIHRRGSSRTSRFLLRVAGPFIALSGFTRRENLVVIAERPS